MVPRSVDGAEAHFRTLTLWESEAAVRAYPGDDATRARYYPEDATCLLEQEPRVLHDDVPVRRDAPCALPEPVNHAASSRRELREFLDERAMTRRVLVPRDGASMSF